MNILCVLPVTPIKDEEIALWINHKCNNAGMTKTGLIRAALNEKMQREKTRGEWNWVNPDYED